MSARCSASRRRRSGSARSSGSPNWRILATARRRSSMVASIWAVRGSRTASGAGRTVASGSSRMRCRSTGSATRNAATTTTASVDRSRWRRITATTRSWSSWSSWQRACATATPIFPVATAWQLALDRRRASSRRPCTQVGLRPSSRATPPGVRPSSAISDSTTRASSITVVVRAGELDSRTSRFRSGPDRGPSTMTGTLDQPASRHRARRLNPSRTSNWSPTGATLNGPSARPVPTGSRPTLRRWYEVRMRLVGTIRPTARGSPELAPQPQPGALFTSATSIRLTLAPTHRGILLTVGSRIGVAGHPDPSHQAQASRGLASDQG